MITLRLRPLLLLTVLLAAAASPAAADATAACHGADNGQRIAGCTELLESPDLPDKDRAMVFALRALAYSVRGEYGLAIPDYDDAIKLDPDFAIAYNNRAWSYFKSGRPADGLADVERALELTPTSHHAFDTRAHIRQSTGRPAGALADYERAISHGGSSVIELYQCGLQAEGHYDGEIDGIYSSVFRKALEKCVASTDCDPLPPDEECRKLTS